MDVYDKDMDTLADYWGIGSDPNYAGVAFRDEWKAYLDAPSRTERDAIAAKSWGVKNALRRREAERLALRKANDGVDTALVRWYEYLPQTVKGRLLRDRIYGR
jgi:hypothetical protein